MTRMCHATLLIAATLLVLASPAIASTGTHLYNPDGSPAAEQAYVWTSKLPTPPEDVTLIRTTCPGVAAEGCTHEDDATIWLSADITSDMESGGTRRTTLLHEVGHRADYWYLDDGERARFMSFFHLKGEWRGVQQAEAFNGGRASEVWADAYRWCATHARRPMSVWYGDVPLVGPKTYVRMCSMVRNFLTTPAKD